MAAVMLTTQPAAWLPRAEEAAVAIWWGSETHPACVGRIYPAGGDSSACAAMFAC